MDLKDLYSTREAADYLGISVSWLRVFLRDKEIVPVALGERRGIDGSVYAHGYVFTRRMLDDFQAGNRPVTPRQDEADQIFNTAGAADYLGISTDSVKQAYHVRGLLRGKTIGRDVVFLLDDLAEYAARERPGGEDYAQALFTADQVRQMRKMYNAGTTIREIVKAMGLEADLTTVYGVVDGRTYKNVK